MTGAGGGWRDVFINFYFNDDMFQYVCEIQLMHTHLLDVREDMGAHHDYGSFRAAVDILNWHADSGPSMKGMEAIQAICPIGHDMHPLPTEGGNCHRRRNSLSRHHQIRHLVPGEL